MLWFGALLVLFSSVQPASVDNYCDEGGQPCIEFYKNIAASYCMDPAYTNQIIDEPDSEDLDLYPWWVEKGAAMTLCCDVLIAPPLLIDTLVVEWWYYPSLDQFGSPEYTHIITNKTLGRTVHSETYTESERVKALLTIDSMTMKDAGAYACKVSGKTEPPGNSFKALTIGRISEPYAITVFSPRLEFKTEIYDDTKYIMDNNEPYTVVDYELTPIDPHKALILNVKTDSSLLQYVDLRNDQKMVVSPYGDIEYDGTPYRKSFIIEIFYEGEEEHVISRTWTITGLHYNDPNTVVRPKYGVSFDNLNVNDVLPFFVIGSCAEFVYKINIDGPNNAKYSLEFVDDWKTIKANDASYNVQYRFTNDSLTGFKNKNAYVEIKLSRDSYETTGLYSGQTRLDITVTCTAGNNDEQDYFQFKGKPMFPSKENEAPFNCLSYDQNSQKDYKGPLTVGVGQRFPCCETQNNNYGTVYAWFNGKPWRYDNRTGHEAAIEALYVEDRREDTRYDWFFKFAGYHQCFVGKYSNITGQEPGRRSAVYRTVKSRTIKMGFNYNQRAVPVVEMPKSKITSFLNASDNAATTETETGNRTTETGNRTTRTTETGIVDVSKYSIIGYDKVAVINGSCVGVDITAKMFPKAQLTWEFANKGHLFVNQKCLYEDRLQGGGKDQNAVFSFIPYDEIQMTSSVYAGPVLAENGPYEIVALLSSATTTTGTTEPPNIPIARASVTVEGIAPYCNVPEVDLPSSGDTAHCTVSGYPIETVTMYYLHNNKEETLHVFNFTLRGNLTPNVDLEISLAGNKPRHVVTISIHNLDRAKDKLGCIAFNPFLPEAQQEKKTEIKIEKSDTVVAQKAGMTVIVVAVIGVALLVLVVWIVVACYCMAKHPNTKFGDAMCCKTGKYIKIPRMVMDPYKLEYFTLNPGVSLGGGHFGIVRRGECNVLPDRRGDLTAIAIKEVKPCIDKSSREEDLKRERDIMMRLRSHSNVLRIYGYTEEPDQLSIVLEFATYGSLDKLLMDARRIKTDGYLMPNEQIDNPIQAFESTHIVEFGRQIADGMDYIGRNNIVHRDLAARNIVVAGSRDEYILKITDFGLAREIGDDGIYERLLGKEIPIKWTAPESLINHNNISTPQSDVWSFGIVLWELCTLGGEPYAGYNNAEVMEKLRSGYRLQKPPTCTDELYDVMKSCWLEVPEDRPQFSKLLTTLTLFSEEPSNYLRIEDIYEMNLDLTLRLQSLQPPSSSPASIPSDPLSPSNPVREPDACLESRDPGHVTSRDVTMATNEYSAEPGSLPNNDTDNMV